MNSHEGMNELIAHAKGFHSRCVRTLLPLLSAAVLVLTACGGPSAPANNSNVQQGSTGSSETANPGSNDTTPQELTKVTMGVSVNTLSFAPIFVAEQLGYFADEGIDMNLVYLDGGGPTGQALIGGSVQFAAQDTGGVTQPFEKGVELLAVQSNVNKLTMDFVLSKEAMQRAGVTRESPVKERFEALRGLTIGITSPGAATDRFTRYYLNQAGLVPEQDTKLLAVGGGPSLAAALKAGQIDGFMLSPPQPQLVEADGVGEIIISASLGDVEGLDNFPYEVIVVMKSYAEKNPDIVRAVVRAVSRANNTILDDRTTALEALQKHFDKVDPDILAAATESVAAAIPRDGLMNEEGWQNTVRIHKMSGMIQTDLDTTEGVFWTNEFLK